MVRDVYKIIENNGFIHVDVSQYDYLGNAYYHLYDISLVYDRINEIEIKYKNYRKVYIIIENISDNELDKLIKIELRKHKIKNLLYET